MNKLTTVKKCQMLRPDPMKFALAVVLVALISCPIPVFAAASLSVSGGDWSIGNLKASATDSTTGDTWTITNDSGSTEDFEISVAVTTGTWTARITDDNSNTTNEFILREDTSAGKLITGTNTSLITGVADAGTYGLDLWFMAPPTGSTEETETLTVTLTATNWVWSCGGSLAISHTAGTVAPVTTSITYGTVATSLSGASKCWITQNLGASQQATSATDNTDASAGWYWQFNRMQGYAVGPIPAWTITAIDEDSNWLAANDPCTIELGTGWRLPTSTEWTNADSTGGWGNYNDTYASDLKLHAAGVLFSFSSGALYNRGGNGYYWGGTQYSTTAGYALNFGSSGSYVYNDNKAYGLSVRCLKD